MQWCSTCFVQDHFLALCYTIFFLALRDSYFICSALFFFLSLRRFFFLPCALRLSYPAQRYFSLLCYAIFFSLLHYSFICFCPVQPYFFSCYSFFFYPCNAQRYCFPYPTLLCIFFCAALCFLFFCPARFFFLIAIIALRNTIYFLSPYLFFFLSCTALILQSLVVRAVYFALSRWAFIFALSCALLLRLLFPPPLCNDVLLALCKIISLPCATLFFFLPYEIAILFVLHYFFFFPCDDFFFCLVHFDYLILHNAISLYCATLYFFLCCIILLFAFALCNHISFLAIHFFFILAMRNAIAFLTLHYYVFSFALHYVFFSFAQRVFFFWLLSLLCAIQFIFFPLTYFFSCLALPYFCAFRSRHSARYFFSLTCNFDFAWPLTIPFCRALFLYWRPLAFLARAPFAPFSRALVRTLCALFCRAFISLLAHTHC